MKENEKEEDFFKLSSEERERIASEIIQDLVTKYCKYALIKGANNLESLYNSLIKDSSFEIIKEQLPYNVFIYLEFKAKAPVELYIKAVEEAIDEMSKDYSKLTLYFINLNRRN